VLNLTPHFYRWSLANLPEDGFGNCSLMHLFRTTVFRSPYRKIKLSPSPKEVTSCFLEKQFPFYEEDWQALNVDPGKITVWGNKTGLFFVLKD
jgi:hypothetical protein